MQTPSASSASSASPTELAGALAQMYNHLSLATPTETPSDSPSTVSIASFDEESVFSAHRAPSPDVVKATTPGTFIGVHVPIHKVSEIRNTPTMVAMLSPPPPLSHTLPDTPCPNYQNRASEMRRRMATAPLNPLRYILPHTDVPEHCERVKYTPFRPVRQFLVSGTFDQIQALIQDTLASFVILEYDTILRDECIYHDGYTGYNRMSLHLHLGSLGTDQWEHTWNYLVAKGCFYHSASVCMMENTIYARINFTMNM